MSRPPSDESRARRDRETAAAGWVLRHDRGLTPAEQDEFSQWLTADRRHRAAFAAQRWTWQELDRVAGLHLTPALADPDLVSPPAPRARPWWRRTPRAAIIGAAAVLALTATALFLSPYSPRALPIAAVSTALAAPCQRLSLDDGSVVDCNRGAQVEVVYSDTARTVRLLHGEASFTVARDPRRPFLVTVGDVTVRAVGTAFNVRMDPHVVEVVVREGQVRVASARTAPDTAPVLAAHQRAVVAHTPAAAPLVSTLSAPELDARLAWQPRLLDFNEAPLPEIVAAFNRHNTLRVAIRDPRLHALRLSATFRSDNVEGFLRLVAAEFGVRVEWRGERDVALHQTPRPE
jgi:transmembrane sensor